MFGINSNKLYNFSFLDANTLIYVAGQTYQIYNYKTKQRRVFVTKDGGGVASVAVNRAQTFFAVAEKGTQPNIYIYEYPSLRLYRILRMGTEKSYSNINFSNDDRHLASVGSSPDFNICVWDWRNEVLVLKSKAFSQEVFKVDFSEFSNNILGTGGLAHIRFWKIANTFTGLKLQGETGKFGQIELSDVTGFYIFPDGKVLSGSENGTLLLWEGNLIKVVISIDEKTPCHDGPINFVKLTKETSPPQIVTAGFDGYIKFWDFDELDNLLSDDNLRGYLQPIRVFKIMDVPYSSISSIFSKMDNLVERDRNEHQDQTNVSKITDIKFYEDFWMIHDSRGTILKFNLAKNILL